MKGTMKMKDNIHISQTFTETNVIIMISDHEIQNCSPLPLYQTTRGIMLCDACIMGYATPSALYTSPFPHPSFDHLENSIFLPDRVGLSLLSLFVASIYTGYIRYVQTLSNLAWRIQLLQHLDGLNLSDENILNAKLFNGFSYL